jgi:hypothetical protein
MSRRSFVLIMVLLGLFVAGMGKLPELEKVPRMSKEDLKARLGDPALAVIDVREKKDWDVSEQKIAGALWEDPAAPEKWAGKYSKEHTLVVYCA